MNRLVLINGPMGVGKSWICNALAATMSRHDGHGYPRFKVISLNTALREAASVVYGVNLMNDAIYSAFKNQPMPGGTTGREAIIELSEGAKKHDPYVWARRFMDKVRAVHDRRTVILCDSFAFPNEWDFFLGQAESLQWLTVYVGDTWELDGPYRQFPGDSRFDLSRHCSLRCANSDQALVEITKSLTRRGW